MKKNIGNVVNVLTFLCVFSILVSIITKLFGTTIFDTSGALNNWEFLNFEWVQYIINGGFILLHYYLIVGCITRLEPKKLFFKLLPFVLLIIVLFFIPQKHYMILSSIIMLVTCIALSPYFSTIIKFIINFVIICLFQQVMIWLRYSDISSTALFVSTAEKITINIDQTIFLTLLYCLNRKGVK